MDISKVPTDNKAITGSDAIDLSHKRKLCPVFKSGYNRTVQCVKPNSDVDKTALSCIELKSA